MTERVKHVRNVAIIFALALIVYAVPGGGGAGSAVENLLSVAMFAALGFFAARMYRERRDELLDMPESERWLLYGSLTLVVVALLLTGRLWEARGVFILIWFALIAAAAAGIATVVQRRRQYDI